MVRAFAIAACLILLAACGRADGRAPFAESRTPPGLGARFFPPEGWTWGYVQVGQAPAQRYGVASSSLVPRAIVLIVPGFGETAEVWFETADDLTDRGYTVWILDRAGQGGSGRYTLPRDLVHVPSFQPDVAGLRAMERVIVRPPPGTPFIVLAGGDGALVAIAAAKAGVRMDGIVLSSPSFAPPVVPKSQAEAFAGRIGAGRLPSPGWRPWSRDLSDSVVKASTHDRWRGRVEKAWETANPDLRMSGPSLGWRSAFAKASRAAEADAKSVKAPVLMLSADSAGAKVCAAMAACERVVVTGARPSLHLEADAWRDVWLGKVAAFVAARSETAREIIPEKPAASDENLK